eukprot:1368897-Amphidinium_carterae.2
MEFGQIWGLMQGKNATLGNILTLELKIPVRFEPVDSCPILLLVRECVTFLPSPRTSVTKLELQ